MQNSLIWRIVPEQRGPIIFPKNQKMANHLLHTKSSKHMQTPVQLIFTSFKI